MPSAELITYRGRKTGSHGIAEKSGCKNWMTIFFLAGHRSPCTGMAGEEADLPIILGSTIEGGPGLSWRPVYGLFRV